MAKLLTDHDPYHLHALLGLFCLLHFIGRWALLFTIGTCWPSWEPRKLQAVGVLAHAALPATSLILPIPAKRMLRKPMIWCALRSRWIWPSPVAHPQVDLLPRSPTHAVPTRAYRAHRQA
jgi:hypothetical protein